MKTTIRKGPLPAAERHYTVWSSIYAQSQRTTESRAVCDVAATTPDPNVRDEFRAGLK